MSPDTLRAQRRPAAIRRLSSPSQPAPPRLRIGAVAAQVLDAVTLPILITRADGTTHFANTAARALLDAPAPASDPPSGDRPAQQARRENVRRIRLQLPPLVTVDAAQHLLIHLVSPETLQPLPVEIRSSRAAGMQVTTLADQREAREAARLFSELREASALLEQRVQEATEQLEERNRRLEQLAELRSRFLASLSHELRTPLSAVLGYAQLMLEEVHGAVPDRLRPSLERLESNARHLADLVDDSLDLARLEAGRMPIHRTHVAIAPLLHELAEELAPLIRSAGLALVIEVAHAPVWRTDRRRLKQILSNLIHNAVRFTAAGSITLRVHPSDDGSALNIDVIDTGVGIAPEQLPGLFEPFQQAGTATRPARPPVAGRPGAHGSGLGLSIVRALVDALGGTIAVRSEVGRGTSMQITLPLHDPAPDINVDPCTTAEPG